MTSSLISLSSNFECGQLYFWPCVCGCIAQSGCPKGVSAIDSYSNYHTPLGGIGSTNFFRLSFSCFGVVKISLIVFFSSCCTDLPTFAPHGVSLDMTDELATARRRCKHLLTRVFGMVRSYTVHCMCSGTRSFLETNGLPSTYCICPFLDCCCYSQRKEKHFLLSLSLSSLSLYKM